MFLLLLSQMIEECRMKSGHLTTHGVWYGGGGVGFGGPFKMHARGSD